MLTRLLPLALCAGCAAPQAHPSLAAARAEVMETERAFAATMARRDHAAFATFLSEDAVFFTDPAPTRGKAAVAERWRRYFQAPAAPFSWQPQTVEVLDSGDLALSSGPVHDPKGALIGTFTSIWRREGSAWRIVFDKGNDACPQ